MVALNILDPVDEALSNMGLVNAKKTSICRSAACGRIIALVEAYDCEAATRGMSYPKHLPGFGVQKPTPVKYVCAGAPEGERLSL